jgi:hypothetical protein
MLRNVITASLIVTFTVSTCSAARNYLKKARMARTASAARIGNGYNRMLDNEHKMVTQASKKQVYVKPCVNEVEEMGIDTLVNLFNDQLLGRIDLLQ